MVAAHLGVGPSVVSDVLDYDVAQLSGRDVSRHADREVVLKHAAHERERVGDGGHVDVTEAAVLWIPRRHQGARLRRGRAQGTGKLTAQLSERSGSNKRLTAG